MQDYLLRKYNEQIKTTTEIIEDYLRMNPNINKNTVIWNLNELVKKNLITRLGRGIYYFSGTSKMEFSTNVYVDVQKVIRLIKAKFKYVDIVIEDSKWFADYIVQQPFSTVVKIEVNEPAVEAVADYLRKNGIEAFSCEDLDYADKYFNGVRMFVIDKIRFNNPVNKINKNFSIAKIEKIMVDIVCDDDIFKQYQGWELENFYNNVTDKCLVNFSTIIRYAASRGRKEEIVSLLRDNVEYKLFLGEKVYD